VNVVNSYRADDWTGVDTDELHKRFPFRYTNEPVFPLNHMLLAFPNKLI
jgi:hypothetical protein